jgi:hypothetical protein
MGMIYIMGLMQCLCAPESEGFRQDMPMDCPSGSWMIPDPYLWIGDQRQEHPHCQLTAYICVHLDFLGIPRK